MNKVYLLITYDLLLQDIYYTGERARTKGVCNVMFYEAIRIKESNKNFLFALVLQQCKIILKKFSQNLTYLACGQHKTWYTKQMQK